MGQNFHKIEAVRLEGGDRDRDRIMPFGKLCLFPQLTKLLTKVIGEKLLLLFPESACLRFRDAFPTKMTRCTSR